MVPDENGSRTRLWEKLVDEQYEDGSFPKFDDLQTVLDIRRLGVKGLIERGIDEPDAEWLLAKLGGAKRGRKPQG